MRLKRNHWSKNQKVFGFGEEILRHLLLAVGFELWPSPYFTLPNGALYRCAILSVSEIKGAYVRYREKIHSQWVPFVGEAGAVIIWFTGNVRSNIKMELANNARHIFASVDIKFSFSWLIFIMWRQEQTNHYLIFFRTYLLPIALLDKFRFIIPCCP